MSSCRIIAGNVNGTAVWSTRTIAFARVVAARTIAFARVVAARTRRGWGDEPTSVLMAAHQAILCSQDGVTGFETRKVP
jgi:hypothetical protein